MLKKYIFILISVQICFIEASFEVKSSELLKKMYGSEFLESEPNWLVTVLDNPCPGYLRAAWPSTNDFYLIDNYANKQYNHTNNISSLHFKLLKNGLWISPSNIKHYLFDENLNLVDSIPNPTQYVLDFHEVELLSNGHYLILCVAQITMDLDEIVQGGLKGALVLSSVLTETDRNGKIYWQWNAIDHVTITDVTPDIDLTQPVIDLTHVNSFVEDNDGNIIVSFRHLDEVSKINKSTGDFIWRMGGSKCKNNEFTFSNDLNNNFVGFSHQHSVSVLPNGNLLMYDNGNMKQPQFSRAVEYQINETSKTAVKVWEYRSDPDIFCPMMGSVYRLPNGNTLINWGVNSILEVRPDKSKAYELTYQSLNPYVVYRAYKYITKMNAVTVNMNSCNNYSFNDGTYTTGVNVTVSSLNGSGNASIEKHDYSPPLASFSDSNFTSILPYRWVFTKNGINSITGVFKIKTNILSNIPDPNKLAIYQRPNEASGTFLEISTNYDAATNEISANISDFGEYILVSKVLNQPTLLSPANNSVKISLNGILKWNNLKASSKYQLQIAKNENFNYEKIEKIIDNSTEYNYKNFEANTKYYWRIRGINSKDTSKWSENYSFTTETFMSVELISPPDNYYSFRFSDTLIWNDISGAEFYWLQVSNDNKFSNFIVDNPNIKETKQQITGLEYNSSYYWRVKAYHNLDTSNWSNVRIFRTVMSKPELISPSHDSLNVETDVNFSWNKVSGAEYYKLEISESYLFNPIIVSSNNILEPNILLKNFDFDKKYYWRVKALRNTDSSDWSAISNYSTLLEKTTLTYPLNFQTKIVVNPKLEWEKSESAATYLLQVSITNDFSSFVIDTGNILTNQFATLELPPNKELFWRVKVVNGTKHSDWSDTWSFITDKGLQLTTPKLNSPKNTADNSTFGDFIWTKVDKAFSYSLQVSLYADFKKNVINASNLTNNSYHFENLEYETIYYWRVKAFSLYDSSQFSETWMMKTLPHSNTITLLSPGNDQLQIPVKGQLTWDEVIEKDYYNLQLSSDPLFITNLIDSNNIKNTYLDYNNLNQNLMYYWRVRFKKSDVYSQWSEVWSFTSVAPETLKMPDLKNPVDQKIGVLVNGALSWEAVPNAETYQISLSKNINFSSIFLKNSDIIQTLFIYPKLEYNQTYYWRVSAVAENAKSSWSVQRSFLTELEQPVILYPEDNSTDIAVDDGLLWSVNDNVALYHVQIAKDSTFLSIVDEEDNLYEMNHNFNLEVNTVYYSRVKSYNDSNQSRWSKMVTFKTGIKTSVENENNSDKISVYPNPAKDYILIQPSEGSDIQIFDMLGTVVAAIHQMTGGNRMNIENLLPGIYYIKIGNKIEKLVKI